MNSKDIRALVAHLQIMVRRITSSDMSGDFASAFRGSGLEFAHLRAYTTGDEIRSIDWKSSAKMNRLMVKEFIQEQERTVVVALDVSASLHTGSQKELKSWYAKVVAACLVMMAQNTNDKTGILIFAGSVIKYLEPRKGASYNAQLVQALLQTVSTEKQTSLTAALTHLMSLRLRNAIIFVVSDWISPLENAAALLAYLGHKNEAVAVRVIDPLERELPRIGILPTIDPETGDISLLSTRGMQGKALSLLLGKRLADQKHLLRKHRFSVLDIEAGASLTEALATFFHKRAH